MKVCVFGAGAVGGHVATRLLAAKAADISVVARGPMLKALREDGVTVHSAGAAIHARATVATDDPTSLPPQEVVLVTLKAYAVPSAAAAIGRLLAPNGCAVFLLNGVPWWWRHGLPGTASTLPLLDPDGALWREVRPERAIGCVVHSSNEITAPGTIVHTGINHYYFGEPDRSQPSRLRAIAEVFTRAGMESRIPDDLRREVLKKLVINAAGNPIAALSHADLGEIGSNDELRALSVGIMREVLATAAAMGWDLTGDMDPEAVAKGGKPGLRPSMLQDVLLCRPIEVEAILGQTQAFAREYGIASPRIDALLPLTRALDRSIRKT